MGISPAITVDVYKFLETMMGLRCLQAQGNNPTEHWDMVMLNITKYITSERYTCLRPPGAAGAILVPDNRESVIIIAGFAAPPIGDTCKDLGECEMENGHCVRTIHAEVNAILLAAKMGVPTKGAKLYSLLKPCYQCTKTIVASGISRIAYAGAAYDEERTRCLLELANVDVVRVDIGLGYG